MRNPNIDAMRVYGYGIPDIQRVTTNSPNRITFYNVNSIKAEEGHIYSVKIPESLRSPGDDYEILVEVTLTYTAPIRRTRQKTKSYLGTWLDWTSSKVGENLEMYKDFAMKEIQGTATNYESDRRNRLSTFSWKINERADWGEVEAIKRNSSTCQKDWAIIRSFELGEEICFTVNGHKGWDKLKNPVDYSFIISIEVLGEALEIYDLIRIENEIRIEAEVEIES
jgi:hypothetical protein